VEAGLPKAQVRVSGEQLRAVFDNVALAEYHCRYDWRDRTVRDIGAGVFYLMRFASPQGSLLLLTPQNFVVVHRARLPRCRASRPSPTQQLLLFELVHTG
jgi:hypothetical protein